ncbi:dihydrofolate reductase [Vagococcus coleopterorum]|uniref:Dihydrofolate reductase n=1 Tax=Vagococcus coleopterorum TaxID=2714946 RepID=A0A6G8ANF7_9ENTE|nr:dihydrofolate reductase [Vagococcus coleopterorum]QIL46614.1 dihydrofolate reductase [Vagococcus coleopterorum]
MLAAIWAQDLNGLIGKESKLPWHLPNDLAFFKRTTEGHTIVMGRTTFEGMGKRALPNRQTVVLTSDKSYVADNAIVMHSSDEVLAYAEKYDGTTFITGGSKVYQQFLPLCDRLYRTVIESEFEGDAYFPDLNLMGWSLIDTTENEPDEKNKFAHRFEIFEK